MGENAPTALEGQDRDLPVAGTTCPRSLGATSAGSTIPHVADRCGVARGRPVRRGGDWSGRRELNPRDQLGRLGLYR
jgi:hypothetical protein